MMKHTIPLKQNHEFRRLYSKGKSAVCPYFAVYCRKTRRPVSRLGITAGVKLGNAVKRNRARRRIRALYRSLIAAMLAGRAVWGVVQMIQLGIAGSGFGWQMFLAGAFLNAVPGIVLQLILIPALMLALHRTGLVPFHKREAAPAEGDC